jgi:hypothetical protein
MLFNITALSLSVYACGISSLLVLNHYLVEQSQYNVHSARPLVMRVHGTTSSV